MEILLFLRVAMLLSLRGVSLIRSFNIGKIIPIHPCLVIRQVHGDLLESEAMMHEHGAEWTNPCKNLINTDQYCDL